MAWLSAPTKGRLLMKPLVLFHKGCLDGTGAALAAYMRFKDEAEYVKMAPSERPPKVTGREVYAVDLAFTRAAIEELQNQAASFVFIDHHKTTIDEFPDNNSAKIILDINRSGAALAWDFFQKLPTKHRLLGRLRAVGWRLGLLRGDDMPPAILDIEDRDLWRFDRPNTKFVNAALRSIGLNDPKKWYERGVHRSNGYSQLVADGTVLLTYEEEQVRRILADAEDVALPGGIKARAVNSPLFQSELGHELAKAHGIGIIWSYAGQARLFRVGLRSIGEIDVSAIAQQFGGGGHKNAAGFTCTKLPWLNTNV